MVYGKEGDKDRVVTHGGRIEGFNTYLSYVPAQQICVVVLGNLNGGAPGQLGAALLDAAMGKPVKLDEEHVTVPIASEELAKFFGVYQLEPDFALTVAAKDGVLTVQGSRQSPITAQYEGLQNGHASFYSCEAHGSLEFIPDAKGTVTALILHQGGRDQEASKK